MENKSLHPEVEDFIRSLQRLEAILSMHEGKFWSERVHKVRQIGEKSDGYSVEMFLGFFGGMGSLNDLILNAPMPVNVEFDAERRRAYKLAQALK
jgi:flagellar motor switch protein FliN/FliY